MNRAHRAKWKRNVLEKYGRHSDAVYNSTDTIEEVMLGSQNRQYSGKQGSNSESIHEFYSSSSSTSSQAKRRQPPKHQTENTAWESERMRHQTSQQNARGKFETFANNKRKRWRMLFAAGPLRLCGARTGWAARLCDGWLLLLLSLWHWFGAGWYPHSGVVCGFGRYFFGVRSPHEEPTPLEKSLGRHTQTVFTLFWNGMAI